MPITDRVVTGDGLNTYTLYYNVYEVVVLAKEVVSARLPRERVNQIEEIAREEKVDKSTVLDRALEHYIREWKLQKAIESYAEGSATLPRAAETAGLTVWEMIDALAKRNIQPQYDAEDLEEDLKAFEND
jgi:predicted HTH domain antitoxin